MKDKIDVLCVGIAVADVLGKPIDFMPEKGKLMLIDEITLSTGGCAVNTAIALAKIGVKVGVIARVGDDGFGEFIISQLNKYGVITDGIKKDLEKKTSATMVAISSEGERSFWHYLGANYNLSLEDISEEMLLKTKILHIAGTNVMPSLDGEPTRKLLSIAKNYNIITSLDTVWNSQNTWSENMEPVFPFLDYFLPNYEEAKAISHKNKPDEIARFFLERGVKVVAIKMGEKGSYVTNGREEYLVPAFKVEVKDTTGAGDAYVAGFLKGVLLGWDIKNCALLGNALGAFCVREVGASSGIPKWEEVLSFINDKLVFK
ncbi:MAG: carbohydrate kinase [Dictyoglomus sp. NZ13-RE01]|nr:MAG: carbohydrate kinase [Dictyoglomus sp. NZ13-RE01]